MSEKEKIERLCACGYEFSYAKQIVQKDQLFPTLFTLRKAYRDTYDVVYAENPNSKSLQFLDKELDKVGAFIRSLYKSLTTRLNSILETSKS